MTHYAIACAALITGGVPTSTPMLKVDPSIFLDDAVVVARAEADIITQAVIALAIRSRVSPTSRASDEGGMSMDDVTSRPTAATTSIDEANRASQIDR